MSLKSKCCGADVKINDITCHYFCSECMKDCEPIGIKSKSEEPQITKLSTTYKISHKGLEIKAEKGDYGKLTIIPIQSAYNNKGFVFIGSNPRLVKAIGEILIKCSEL